MKLKIVRRCSKDSELPKIVNYGVTISKKTTIVLPLHPVGRGVE